MGNLGKILDFVQDGSRCYMNRTAIISLFFSAAALVGLVTHEGYTNKAVIPIPGDVPTVGFGTTEGVKMGDSTTPVKALERAYKDVTKFEGAVKQCVKVPLHQYEYDAYISLAYNVGTGNFCSSTLVKKLNDQDYAGACKEILRWDRAKGRVVKGLTIRRQEEHKKCLGPL
jgi:lysozyme